MDCRKRRARPPFLPGDPFYKGSAYPFEECTALPTELMKLTLHARIELATCTLGHVSIDERNTVPETGGIVWTLESKTPGSSFGTRESRGA